MRFLKPSADSMRGFLNTEEVVRIAWTSGFVSILAGATAEFLRELGADSGRIFASPAAAAMGGALLTILADTVRRLNHDEIFGSSIGLQYENRRSPWSSGKP